MFEGVTHVVVTNTMAVLACSSNFFFIYIILTTPSQSIGNYRYLLISFASSDILMSICHAVFYPCVEITDYGFGFFSLYEQEVPFWVKIFEAACFIGFFYQTILLLALHFVYRYAALCKPIWMSGFLALRWGWRAAATAFTNAVLVVGFTSIAVITLYPSELGYSIYDPIVRQTYGYGLNRTGWINAIFSKDDGSGGRVWIWETLIAISVIWIMIFATITVIVFCALKITAAIRSPGLSAKTRSLQQQLFTALLVQTLIPCIFSYGPVAFIILIPITGMNALRAYGNPLIMSLALFPTIDPLLIIAFIGVYRTASIAQLRKLAFWPACGATVSPSSTLVTKIPSDCSRSRSKSKEFA